MFLLAPAPLIADFYLLMDVDVRIVRFIAASLECAYLVVVISAAHWAFADLWTMKQGRRWRLFTPSFRAVLYSSLMRN